MLTIIDAMKPDWSRDRHLPASKFNGMGVLIFNRHIAPDIADLFPRCMGGIRWLNLMSDTNQCESQRPLVTGQGRWVVGQP
jgi:hypothetical protein